MSFNAMNMKQIMRNIERKQNTIIRNSLKTLSAPKYIEVGWTSKSGKYPDSGIPVTEVVKIHEFGLGPHTEKAFIRVTQEENTKQWLKLFEAQIKKTLRKGSKLTAFDKTQILFTIGQQIKIDLKQKITDIDLVDTTRLKNSILITFRRR